MSSVRVAYLIHLVQLAVIHFGGAVLRSGETRCYFYTRVS